MEISSRNKADLLIEDVANEVIEVLESKGIDRSILGSDGNDTIETGGDSCAQLCRWSHCEVNSDPGEWK